MLLGKLAVRKVIFIDSNSIIGMSRGPKPEGMFRKAKYNLETIKFIHSIKSVNQSILHPFNTYKHTDIRTFIYTFIHSYKATCNIASVIMQVPYPCSSLLFMILFCSVPRTCLR